MPCGNKIISDFLGNKFYFISTYAFKLLSHILAIICIYKSPNYTQKHIYCIVTTHVTDIYTDYIENCLITEISLLHKIAHSVYIKIRHIKRRMTSESTLVTRIMYLACLASFLLREADAKRILNYGS